MECVLMGRVASHDLGGVRERSCQGLMGWWADGCRWRRRQGLRSPVTQRGQRRGDKAEMSSEHRLYTLAWFRVVSGVSRNLWMQRRDKQSLSTWPPWQVLASLHDNTVQQLQRKQLFYQKTKRDEQQLGVE